LEKGLRLKGFVELRKQEEQGPEGNDDEEQLHMEFQEDVYPSQGEVSVKGVPNPIGNQEGQGGQNEIQDKDKA
jgi:hypothetical protein